MSHIHVLQTDGQSSDAYVTKSFATSIGDDWYIEFEFYIPSALPASLASHSRSFSGDIWEWGPTGSADTLFLQSAGGGVYDIELLHGTLSVLASDVWHKLQFHTRFDSGLSDWFQSVLLDGVDPFGGEFQDSFSLSDIHTPTFNFGQHFANHISGEIVYIDNVKIGTTFGGSEIFSDDFEGGSLSAWTSVTGSATIIVDPTSTVLDTNTVIGATSIYVDEAFDGIHVDASSIAGITSVSALEAHTVPFADSATVTSKTIPSAIEDILIPTGSWGIFDDDNGVI